MVDLVQFSGSQPGIIMLPKGNLAISGDILAIDIGGKRLGMLLNIL